MSSVNFEKEILKLGERRQIEELEKLVDKIPTNRLIESLIKRIGKSDVISLWNYLLLGFSNNENSIKRFACVKAVLKELSTVELTYKQTYDIITRLFLDLPSFSNDQLIEIVEYSIETLKMGDPKCVGWKDLLPESVNILSRIPILNVNSVRSTGQEYKTMTVRNLCTMKWPITVLTPIANMFRDMNLSSEEATSILTKFCFSLQRLAPLELPALAFQLFSLCKSSNQIVMLIVAMQRYFHKYYYQKLYASWDSEVTDYDSIDKHSDKELRESEETILHHLNDCTQYKITEGQLINTLRGLASCPDVILTPFFLSSILTMSKSNRDPDTPLTASIILPYLRNVIKNNEDEKELTKSSAWCRDTIQTRQVDFDKICTVLIDQNKDGKDVVTPGLVNLAFTLLKAKNSPKLNNIGIKFLQQFIKKRFIFGQGVVKKLAEWMILDQESMQYSECLTALSFSDTFTISECVKTIKYVLDFMLWIPGNHAMRMMPFVLPIVKISHTIRDEFISTLKKAMYSKETHTCRMGVYGFCMLLKQLNNNNSQRTAIGSGNIFTQQSISGFSLMSQTTLGNRNNPQRHFDMLTLEIIGLLRNCFNEPLPIKETLYEGLTRAVELNFKLIPHILQFVDWHFRNYFEIDETNFEIKFDKLIRTRSDGKDIEVSDSLGQLMMFVAFCVYTCEKHELVYDISVLQELFTKLIEQITEYDLARLEIRGNVDHKMNQILHQYLSIIEAVMYYTIWTSKCENRNVTTLFKLFKHHQNIRDQYKGILQTQSKKPGKKGKPNETDFATQNITINGNPVKKVILKSDNIWDLPTLERFLRLLQDDRVSFTSEIQSAPLRSDRDIVRYITQTATTYIENIRSQPEYRQMTHSKRIFQNLTEITRLLYGRCIKRLPKLWTDFDVTSACLSAECFRQCLLTVDSLFKRKFNEFLKGVDLQYAADGDPKKITTAIQEVIENSMEDRAESDVQPRHEKNSDMKKIPVILLQCLEVLYENIPHDDNLSLEAYNWIFKFCQNYEIHQKDMGVPFKLLFEQRCRTHTGVFFNSIAMQIEGVYGKIDEEVTVDTVHPFILKSITEGTVETCLIHLLNILKKQIDDVEYFISKARCFLTRIKITSERDQEQCIQWLKSIERSICSALIHISNIILHLTNTCIPLGICMDTLIKILMQMYICLTNLTKHFILRHTVIPISFQAIKFDHLLRCCGKPLATRIYSLITYIEANIFEETSRRKTNDPKSDKAKVLKETKFLPKLIMRVENLNKFVILLSKKTNSHLAHYLHIGTVRDFRIKTSELKEAINKTLTHSSEIEVDESMLEEDNGQQSDSDDIGCPSVAGTSEKSKRSDTTSTLSGLPRPSPDSQSSSSSDIIREENRHLTGAQVLENLEKVNKKIRKRKTDPVKEIGPKKKRGKK